MPFDPTPSPDTIRYTWPRETKRSAGVNGWRGGSFRVVPFPAPVCSAIERDAYWKWVQEGISRQAVLPRNMHEAFEEMVQKVISGQVGRIHFNLDGISDPLASAEFARSGLEAQLNAGQPVNWMAVGLTNAELNAIRSDPQLLRITVFYRQGQVVPSPFERG